MAVGPRKQYNWAHKFDSKFENAVAEHLRSIGVEFEYEKESFIFIKTVRKAICRTCGGDDCGQKLKYTPDFFLGNGIILEAKGYLDAPTRERHRLMRDQHPGLDLRLVFQKNNVIKQTKKKERYSDWATRLEIPFCVGMPPKDWLEVGQWE